MAEFLCPLRQLLIAVSSRGVGYTTLQADDDGRGGAERAESATCDVRLRPPLSLRVEVVDGAGEPVAGARVQAFPESLLTAA